MIVVIQICSRAKVTVGNKELAKIKNGILVFLGIEKNDNEMDVSKIVNKIYKLRIFNDEQGKMNLSIKDVKASAIAVSQLHYVLVLKKVCDQVIQLQKSQERHIYFTNTLLSA
tara:strand:- start:131 stop:469 length:339 start_codon:yes stop_codon:yes gene_type:complete